MGTGAASLEVSGAVCASSAGAPSDASAVAASGAFTLTPASSPRVPPWSGAVAPNPVGSSPHASNPAHNERTPIVRIPSHMVHGKRTVQHYAVSAKEHHCASVNAP